MAERPILFSGPMVRALLAGTKTQTRRAVKPQPAGEWAAPGRTSCPYGQLGDRLWVRETWADLTATHGQRWEKRNPVTGLYERGQHPFFWYAADGDQPDLGGGERNPERWRPSIHMPRHACRLVLEVTGVRVERLQAISEDDALAEGIDTEGHDYLTGERWKAAGSALSPERYAFASLWRRINGQASWDANPWVWVVEFKVVAP